MWNGRTGSTNTDSLSDLFQADGSGSDGHCEEEGELTGLGFPVGHRRRGLALELTPARF
jgi:hypothetical protein